MASRPLELDRPASPTLAAPQEGALPPRRRRLVDTWQAFVHDPVVVAAAAVLLLVVLAAVFADALVSAGLLPSPRTQNLAFAHAAPGSSYQGVLHLLGTDQLGRDLLSRLVYAARVSLAIGAVTVVVAGWVGVVLGLLAGFYRGTVDEVIMRVVDIQMGFPSLLLALIVLYAAGPSFINLVLVLALTRWVVVARVTRAMTLSLRQEQFIEAARVSGATHTRMMRVHILPNVMTQVVVLATLEFARAMLSEASLSFLGVGIQPPDTSWGLMLAEGRQYLTTAWWLVAFPGLAVMLTAMSVNMPATWTRAITDPAQRDAARAPAVKQAARTGGATG
jgi:peptide/nickel transport system permease protein